MSRANAADSRFIIGIDLGTTQCALSYVDLEDKNLRVRNLEITQLVSGGMLEGLPTLPSVIYLCEEERLVNRPPWMDSEDIIVGAYARELGFEIPGRFVHSSKSWLCHPRAERQSPILPWQSEVVGRKISPVEAATSYLAYLGRLWNATIGVENEAFAFLRQKVIVTVPASFDPSARNLTLEAIDKAGIRAVSLIEEPQAAFYDYLQRNPKTMVGELKGIDTVLVIDIGGGTTDFSLIRLNWSADRDYPEFSRLAVGPHLLIGGDNLDLALARRVEAEFKHRGRKLAGKQWLSLLAQSHTTKEQVLAGEVSGAVHFNLAGSGSKVLAGAAKISLESEEIKKTLVDGFFPLVGPDEKPDEDNTLGLSEAGLPFTRDAAVTRHLAAFLRDNDVKPDAILFNGGTMQADCLRNRLFEVLTLWRGTEPKVLENPHPTLAVAAGAAYYGLVTLGMGQRIQSGNPVSVYLGIGTAKSSTTARHVPEQLMCILPKGSEAEKDYHMAGKTLGIDLSHDSAFYLFYTPAPPKAEESGRLIKFNSKRYLSLPPCVLKARTSKGEKQVEIRVRLRETGYLQIFCEEIGGSFSQELRFDLGESEKAGKGAADAPAKRRVPLTSAQLKKIATLLTSAFSEKIEYNSVFKELESIIGSPRTTWDAEMLRQLFDLFIERESEFRSNQNSLVLWFRLLGFCLRPGFGVQGDTARIDRIWQMIDDRYDYSNAEFWSDWWIMWKRIAPGLSIERQEALKSRLEPVLFQTKRRDRKDREVGQHERNQLWRLFGHLERISVAEKERIGWWIIKAPPSYGVDAVALSALARLGARELAYAPDSAMVSQAVANAWAEQLLKKAMPGNSYLDTALREIGRKTGDRLVQIDDLLRKHILDVFKKKLRKKAFIQPLLKAARLEEKDLAELVGEALPSGFVWVKDAA
ncbi:MAG TPA: Hsp70 family protein [Candidatus Rifleibacterium sp.]|nr:Hsp70 family protein [Candidatus Rifleibacterium sp.]HPT45814.1 Hsp70 family protein [Candidatus Rifleibacterium sp.]